MQKFTELAVCLIVILDVSTQDGRVLVDTFHNPTLTVKSIGKFETNIIVFIDPLDFPKKSCPRGGLLADVDYAIITGFINVTSIGHPPTEAKISLLYVSGRGIVYIPHSITDLRTAGCAQVQQQPPNSCRCLEQDGKIMRVKCNMTLERDFTFMDTLCGQPRKCACSSNQGSSLLGSGYPISGIVIIFTAFVLAVSSLLSHGQ